MDSQPQVPARGLVLVAIQAQEHFVEKDFELPFWRPPILKELHVWKQVEKAGDSRSHGIMVELGVIVARAEKWRIMVSRFHCRFPRDHVGREK